MTTSNQASVDQDTIVEKVIEDALLGSVKGTMDSQTFTIYPNYVECVVGRIKKSITLLDFKGIIDNLLKVDQQLSHIALPYNCFSFAKSASEIQLSCYYPERIAEITHIESFEGNPKTYKLPFPNTVISFVLTLKDGFWQVRSANYFCTNKKVTQLPEDKLLTNIDFSGKNGIWRMPFPNFYDNANMCYGRNTMPSRFTNNLGGLDYYYQVIFESPFNNDLGIGSTQLRYDPKSWFAKLAKLTAFPYDELRK